MSEKRRDNKGRILRQGELQRSDGKYEYRYFDAKGERRSVYSWKLVSTDKIPKGKRECRALRDIERDIRRDIEDGINSHEAYRTSLNRFFDDYIEIKYELKSSTRTNYKYIMRWNQNPQKKKSVNLNFSLILQFIISGIHSAHAFARMRPT